MAKATVEALNTHAQALINGLQSIPVDELVACARENLKAVRRIRLSKDDPEGTEEPDYATRQKALQFITEQCAGAAATRKPIEAVVEKGEERPSPGLLKGKKG